MKFSDLSSGEKILISLGIWMFNASRAKRLPKLLLLDEPDAHLHPSAIKDFINVIENTLVKKHDVRVILTTHSPTTVSFAPEYSLFEMSKDVPQVKHIESKEYGINLLTEGLVVVKSNTKYVLVEDKDDAQYFNTVFSILKNADLVNKDISVIFIPSSNHKASKSGGCSVVRSWVEKFVLEGVFDVFQGLVDGDAGKHDSAPNIHVLNRYSLENYLLDPILVFSSIVHENPTYEIVGIDITHKNEHSIRTLEESKLQSIANHILSEIEPAIGGVTADQRALEQVAFSNEVILQYPKWFLNYRGHDLYAKFHAEFKKPVNVRNMINALLRHEFIPINLCNIINNIQNT